MKVMITVEVENHEEARLIARGLQDKTLRSLAIVKGKLIEMDVDPREHDEIIKMAREIRYGKGRH